MVSLAEIKAEVRPRVARLAFEKLVPSLSLKEVESPSLERAWELDRKGRWEKAVHVFYTLYQQEQEPELRAEAGIVGLPQMLINLAKFGQARGWLNRASYEIVPQIKDENDRHYFEARIEEKLGWIADYEGDFSTEIKRLNEARRLIKAIPEEKRGEREEKLLSTTTHFLGRAHLGLALQGVDKKENAKMAIGYFGKDLARYQELRERGEPVPAGEGFNHGWLARSYLELDEEGKAEKEIDLAGQLFAEHTRGHPESGVLAHWQLLRGKLVAKRGEAKQARFHFEEALRIRTEVESYPKGEADAAIGIAWTYVAEGKYGAALPYFLFALRKYPAFLLRGFF